MEFDTPVRQSLLVELVGDKADLSNAIALNSLLMNSSRLIGPSIAGLLLAVVSEGVCFLVNALSYVAILAAAAALQVAQRARPAEYLGLREGLLEGIRYAWNSLPIRMLLPLVALVSFTVSPYVTLMPVIAREVLGGGRSHSRFPRRGCRARSAYRNFVARDAQLGTRPGTRHRCRRDYSGHRLDLRFLFPLVVDLAAVDGSFGFGIIVTAASVNTVLQTIVDDDKRGRVMSFYTMAFLGVAPLGA